MEQYGHGHEVKEKSVYLVHLDNTRIVILASVLVGIVALSFMIGMRMQENQTDDFFVVHPRTSSFSSDLAPSENDEIDKLINEGSSLDELTGLDNSITPSEATSELTADDLTKTPEKSVEPIAKKKPEVKPAPKPKSSPKPVAKKAEPKKPVVAVSAPAPKPAVDKYTATPKGFSIQVASFDSESKAVSESSVIRSMRYSTFIDKAMVNGKQFYRVKVGPFPDKHNAFATLNKLHSITKYADSFVVHEK
jgi:cell division septation protein DedD